MDKAAMIDNGLFHVIVVGLEATFRSYFPAIGDQDYASIVAGEADLLIEILQRRYGCGKGEARGAWNDFVLHHVDGEMLIVTLPNLPNLRTLWA